MRKPLGSTCGEIFDESDLSIAEKRNFAIKKAIEDNADVLFMLGDDVIMPTNGYELMLRRWREGAKAVTGVYWSKTPNPEPYIYRGYMNGAYYDWKAGDYIDIDWAGCDCLLLDVQALKKLKPPYFSLEYDMSFSDVQESRFGQANPTEDLYFYAKLKDAGIQLKCDTAIQCWHEDRKTGMLYGLVSGMPQLNRGFEAPFKGKLIADIGSGSHTSMPHLYQDNTVVRFDMDESCKPDFVCDVRNIPEEDNVFDIAVASHVLEHLKWDDVIPALQEWVRILKVGGELTVKVPNLQFAAQKILEDNNYTFDARWKHPYEMLMVYGSQDGVGMYHHSGFTPNVLKEYVKRALGDSCEYTVTQSEVHNQAENQISDELTLKVTKLVAAELPKVVGASFMKSSDWKYGNKFKKGTPESNGHDKEKTEELKNLIEA